MRKKLVHQSSAADADLQISELICHGVEPVDLSAALDTEAISAIRASASQDAEIDQLSIPQLIGSQCFAMTCDGHVVKSWPDDAANLLHENLVAQFFDLDEMCRADAPDTRLYRVSWTAMAADGEEYLLISPIRSKGRRRPRGLLVLCISERRRERARADRAGAAARIR
jgi:hypothetical protein